MRYLINRRSKRALSMTAIVILLTWACSDSFLEVPPTGSLSAELLNGSKGIEATLLAVYAQVNGRANRMASPSNWVWGSIRGGEANKGTDPGDFSDINPIQRFETLPTQGVVLDKYTGTYEGIARANAVMRLLQEPGDDVTPEFATQMEAETKFLRAHFYFELKRTFDDTPYVDENVDYATGIELVPNNVDLWPLIEADMQFAYDNLPETQGQLGRVNKWAAAAYLGKIYLYQHKYAEALAKFNEVIDDGVTSSGDKYGLVPLYADIFKAANDNHEESIWAYQSSAGTGSVNNANPEFDLNWPYNTGPDGPGNCCGFFQPSFELGNSFRTSGGLPLLDGSYNVGANQVKTDMGIESADPFTPDAGELDPRIDHSIGRRGIPYLDWPGIKDDNDVYQFVFPGKAWIRNQPNGGPYAPKKYVYYKSDVGVYQDNSSWTPGYTGINVHIIRFADVLLMAAECEIEVGDPETAREYVNMIRTRAADPAGFVMKDGSPAADYVITTYPGPWVKDDAARQKVQFERKLELSGEGHRFYDLVRWGNVASVVNAYLTYEAPKLPSGALVGATFQSGQDELLPIPQSQIDIIGSDILQQNPGYDGN